MRISGVLATPGHVRLMVAGAGVFLCAVAVTVVANLLGLLGFSAPEDTGERVRATVSAGAPCDPSAAAGERVRFSEGGREWEVRFDGCGHAEGEQVEITVPAGAVGEDLTVRAAHTAGGDGDEDGGTVGSLLLFASSAACGAFVHVLRRAQDTSPGGESQVLH